MKQDQKLHFVAIGGIGMSGIAAVMHGRGAQISGSDLKESDVTRRLREAGMTVEIGHKAENVGDVDLVVVSAAVPDDNPEVVAAKEKGIPVVSRAEMLGRLMAEYKHRIAISGTHGKTTTTSMASLMLLEAGLDPTILIGGDMEAIAGNAKLGAGDIFLTEACEAFSSFLHLHPSIAVVTNIDADHLDHHGSLENIKGVFRQFLSQVDDDGCIIACGDDENLQEIIPALNRRVVQYGIGSDNEIRAVDVDIDSATASFEVERKGERLGRVSLGTPGLQNVLNALAVIGVGIELGARFGVIQSALAKYKGVGRRFEILGEASGVMVVDDYAHHPTEIAATLDAAKHGWKRRIVAVFQPHLYSRTRFFLKDFARSLSLADHVIITDIYAAREKPIPGVCASQIVEAMATEGKTAEYIADKREIPDRLLPELQPDDMVIVMGAGDIRIVGEEIFARLSETIHKSDKVEVLPK
ncbi:MAG: UDP-N-acetylmuramate--L-alanine ligase [Armatimonadota bacterium]|nr:UDP-N-acetylmuramate--L-alanine ligase [Armatimonadota bacterium]